MPAIRWLARWRKPVRTMFERSIDTNIFGTLTVIQAALPLLRGRAEDQAALAM